MKSATNSEVHSSIVEISGHAFPGVASHDEHGQLQLVHAGR
jgi:hypothetical protein